MLPWRDITWLRIIATGGDDDGGSDDDASSA
jgi:hypothetical protein